MSTRSLIGVYFPNIDKVLYVYCHSDGYPDHMIPALKSYKTTLHIYDEIIKDGGFVYLDQERGVQKRYVNDEPQCISLHNFVNSRGLFGADYRYLFMDNKWMVFDYDPHMFDEDLDDEYCLKIKEKLDALVSSTPNRLGGYNFL